MQLLSHESVTNTQSNFRIYNVMYGYLVIYPICVMLQSWRNSSAERARWAPPPLPGYHWYPAVVPPSEETGAYVEEHDPRWGKLLLKVKYSTARVAYSGLSSRFVLFLLRWVLWVCCMSPMDAGAYPEVGSGSKDKWGLICLSRRRSRHTYLIRNLI